MATIERSEAPARVVLNNVAWETYEMLLRDRGDQTSPRFTYDRGRLEIMAPELEHERFKELIGTLVVLWTMEKRIPQVASGSMTIRKRHLLRGLEADQCYYVRNEPAVRGKRKLDLSVDPPPDLAIEVDITRSSLEKLDIYEALGVPEVWLFNGDRLQVNILAASGGYVAGDESLSLPDFPIAIVPEWIERAFETDNTTWALAFQAWMRRPGAG
jgi:Uma2 family endonuclease